MADWVRESNFLVVVAVPDELTLEGLVATARVEGLAHTAVREPDIGDELTAVALEPGARAKRLCARLPLALRECAMT